MSRRLGVTLLEIVLAVLVVGLLVWCLTLQLKVKQMDNYLGAPDGLVAWTKQMVVDQRTVNGLHGVQLEFLCEKWRANRPRGDTSVCPTVAPPGEGVPGNSPCYPRPTCPH